MGIDDNSDSGFPSGSGTLLNCLSSGMHTTSQSEKVVGTRMSSLSMCKSSDGGDLPFGSRWDPVFSLSQNVEFKGSLMPSHGQIGNSLYTVGALENQGATSTSHLVQYPSDPCFVEMVPKLPSFGCGSFTEMVGSIGVEDGLISSSSFPPNCPSNKEDSTEKTTNPKKSTDHYAHFHEDHQISNERTIRTSPNGKKRKRIPGHSQLDPIEAGLEQREEVSGEIPEVPNEQDDKKQRVEQSHGGHSRGKLTGKQYKDSSQNGEAANDEFIHVRARRGQATNSHSLAERVRREKISQRMRFLQDLVPGCNKITGKAVMLDEIINYVQSLQRQVEFLSMKLATVNPELNIDIERILSKDILYSQGGPSAILGFGPGVSTSHPQPYVTPRGALPAIQSTNPHFPPMLQTTNVWDDELQNVIQMGFISDLAPNNLGSDACTKVEL